MVHHIGIASSSSPDRTYHSFTFNAVAPLLLPAAMQTAITVTPLTIPAQDDFPIAVNRFEPKSPAAVKATCVIVNATGVQARFYGDWAAWLASHGVATCTFDFRFSGASFPPDVLAKLSQADREHSDDPEAADLAREQAFEEALLSAPREWGLISHWTHHDLATVVRYVRTRWAGAPLTLLGNSLGGHIIALLEEDVLFGRGTPADPTPASVRLLNVCGGNAYWGNSYDPPRTRYGFEQMIAQPLESEGVFRASSLGLGYDIPYGVGRDWCKWFFHPLFSLQGPREQRQARRVVPRVQRYLYVGFEDDETISQRMMEQQLNMLDHSSRNVHSLWVDPPRNDPPWPKCGHVTSFSPSSKKNRIASQLTRSDVDGAQGADVAHESGAEGYEAHEEAVHAEEQKEEAAQGGAKKSHAPQSKFTREETIFALYLDYILHGRIWGVDGGPAEQGLGGIAHKAWTVEDERDGIAMRRQERERRRVEREKMLAARERAQGQGQARKEGAADDDEEEEWGWDVEHCDVEHDSADELAADAPAQVRARM